MSAPATEQRWSFITELRDPDGYLIVLLLTVIQLVLWPLFDVIPEFVAVAFVLTATTLLLALHRARAHRAWLTVAYIILAILAVFSIAGAISSRLRANDAGFLVAAGALLYGLVVGMTFPLVVRRAFQHSVVGLSTLAAALSAYLFLGMFYAGVIRFIGENTGNFFAQPVKNNAATAFYFAFETLTTLGMGDLTPGPQVARVVTILCALSGQIFLVTAVARLVSLWGQERGGRLVEQ
ncbi:MAG: ion channel [Acidimicrobiia bacterium]